MTPQSIYRLRTDGQQASQYIPRRSLRSLGGYNNMQHATGNIHSSSLVLSFYRLIYFSAERIFHNVFTFDDITRPNFAHFMH